MGHRPSSREADNGRGAQGVLILKRNPKIL